MNHEFMYWVARQKQQERLREAELSQALERSRPANGRRVEPMGWLETVKAQFQDWAPTRQRTGA